jgi:hypothetical protein
MRKGSKSFVGFAAFTIPAVLVFAFLTGGKSVLFGLLGIFFVLQFANRLDNRSQKGSR